MESLSDKIGNDDRKRETRISQTSTLGADKQKKKFHCGCEKIKGMNNVKIWKCVCVCVCVCEEECARV